MEKIRKIDVGTLLGDDSHSEFENAIRKRSYMKFENGGDFDDSSAIFELNGKHCYIVSKDDLDAYVARKGSLEKTKGTPEWYLSNRLKQLEAENANLRDINKFVGEEYSKLAEAQEALNKKVKEYKFYGMCSAESELKTENEKLAAEVDDLNKRINRLNVILEYAENREATLIRENNKLRGTKNELDATVAKLRQALAKFNGEHTVEFLYEKHEDGKHIIGWTEVSGEEYELTFVTQERKIHE